MDNGQTVILYGPRARSEAVRVIDAAPTGSVVHVKPPKRSLDQNAKWHAMISDIARAKPDGRVHDVRIWKALLMADAGFQPIFERSLDGNSIVHVGFKSSRLNKSDFSDLIESTLAYGARHQVVWSDESRKAEG